MKTLATVTPLVVLAATIANASPAFNRPPRISDSNNKTLGTAIIPTDGTGSQVGGTLTVIRRQDTTFVAFRLVHSLYLYPTASPGATSHLYEKADCTGTAFIGVDLVNPAAFIRDA